MANTQSSSILSGAYANPFAKAAKPAQAQGLLPPAESQAKPEFAALIAEMDGKLLAHSQKTTKAQSETVAQNSGGEYTFFDLIDMINPLQHIPVVSNLYRAITGDEIRQEVRMAGNVLFGALTGPVGVAMGVGSAAVDYASGKPVGDHVLAAVAPNLEATLREEYSIAHYLHNPFGDNETAEVAAVQDIAVDTVPQTSRRDSDASAIYAQTASALGAQLNKGQPQTVAVQASPLDLPAHNGSSVQTAMLPVEKEAQAMARSVAYDPQSIVQLSPEASAQLSRLASGTTQKDNLGLDALIPNSDGAAQLRAVTAKNRQLGIALNSSASINHQLDASNQRAISHQISDKVAALYNQNADITQMTLQDAQQSSVPSLFDASVSEAVSAPTQVAQNSSPRQQPLQPQQLGKHYHGVHNVGNLSIAAAMQQALDKYQNLRRN